MTSADLDYYRSRERQERAAAKNSETLSARRSHQELAARYAAIIHSDDLMTAVSVLRRCGAL